MSRADRLLAEHDEHMAEIKAQGAEILFALDQINIGLSQQRLDDQVRDIIAEAAERKKRARGRPRRDKFADIDAWLIVYANDLFRSGSATSPWAAIAAVAKGAWSAWDNGTRGGMLMQEVLIGNTILRAPPGKSLSRVEVLGQSVNAIEQRVLARLRPNKRLPLSVRRNGRTVVRFRPVDIYAHLPIYKALKPRKAPAGKRLSDKVK
jgi:hypothetical protein